MGGASSSGRPAAKREVLLLLVAGVLDEDELALLFLLALARAFLREFNLGLASLSSSP